MNISKEQLQEMYNKYTAEEIAQNLTISPCRVRWMLWEFGIKKEEKRKRIERQNNYIISYFSKWTPPMAYIIGFIMCDGYIYKDSLHIEIQQSDIGVLDFIYKELKLTTSIYNRTRVDKRTGTESSLSKISIHGRDIVSCLYNIGISEQKTGKESIPFSVPHEFFWDFLRGVIDGDGSVIVKDMLVNNKLYIKPTLQVCSASLFFLQQLFCVCGGKIYKQQRNCYVWQVHRRKDILDILEKVYNGGFCLERKYMKYKKILEYDQKMSLNKISIGTIKGINASKRNNKGNMYGR